MAPGRVPRSGWAFRSYRHAPRMLLSQRQTRAEIRFGQEEIEHGGPTCPRVVNVLARRNQQRFEDVKGLCTSVTESSSEGELWGGVPTFAKN
jgi:hypothetical protein